MKQFKIEKNQVFFNTNNEQEEWKPIDKIQVDDLKIFLSLALNGELNMDEYSDYDIRNPAHNIIYKSIYQKLTNVINNKDTILDTIEQEYMAACEKYQP